MDRSYYVAPRTPSEVPTGRATSVKVTEERPPLTKSSRTRSREIVDRPLFTEAVPGDAVEKSSLSKPASVDTDVEAQDRLGVKEATNRTDIYNLGYPIELDHNDDVSVTSSDEGSVFSIASLASSATDLSKGSGYSPVQIATATRELLSIFRDDEVLYPLYTTAIHGVIGPRKFVNTFRRMLKAFADKLKDEAQDRLDFLAARLVALKAREIADAILEIHQLGKAPDLVVVEGKRVTILERDDEDSSDEDEQEETNVDETGFEDLTNVREFLVQSAAFKLLRTDLQYYVSSKRQSKDPSSERDEKMYLDERVNGIAKLIEPGFQTCAHVQSTKSGVEQDCLNQLRNDRPLFELHLYALDILGEDRFVIEYSDLLRRYYSNAGASVDNKVDNRMGGNIDAQLGTVWQPVASAVVLHLEIADANESCWKDQTSDSKTDKSFFIDLLSREGKDLRCATTPHLLSRDLALLTLRRPLRELFTHTPGYIIEMTSVNDSSFVNRTKASLEDYTMAEWDWWPLAPRIPDVAPGECRLEWKVRF
ncbi:hypothetical protein BKA58DRAFT_89653 [Alternaria rosae]|uniref:uncharacterized protein n=1 Tax=Alternaria rosae TaxID=1187941 RepID=UPI001E8EEFDD|nr:uncharacterized protein BKA58DRAFT_89653 [Alternaria rosae]KAH6878149.1 hypothetical protein BKA58DRAFT_89653 [Alternaria rosae]